VRRRPYSVVLFDEVEKAHPDVWNVLLQVLDDGRLTDSQGRVVDFKNTLILLTSNLGGRRLAEGGEGAEEDALAEVRGHFRPEFLNRLDGVVTFSALNEETVRSIVQIQSRRLARRAADHGLKLCFTDAAVSLVAREGWEPAYGARPIKRALQRLVEDPLSQAVLEGRFAGGAEVTVDAADGIVVFSSAKGEVTA